MKLKIGMLDCITYLKHHFKISVKVPSMAYHKISHSVSPCTNPFQANHHTSFFCKTKKLTRYPMQTRCPNNSNIMHMVNNKTYLIPCKDNNNS